MKYIFICALFFLLLTIENIGQIYGEKGKYEIGGSISFTSSKAVIDGESSGDALNQLAIYIPANYFMEKGWTIGILPTFELFASGNSSVTGYLIGLSTAYNFIGETNIIPYVEGRFFYNAIIQSTGNNSTEINGIGWTILAGLKVQATDNVLINTGISYTQRNLEDKEYEGGRIGSNIIGLSTGFLFYF